MVFLISKKILYLTTVWQTAQLFREIFGMAMKKESLTRFSSSISSIQPVFIKSETPTSSHKLIWHDLNVLPGELRPNLTLRMGQCFNWKKVIKSESLDTLDDKDDSCIWIGVIDDNPIAIRQKPSTSEYMLLTDSTDSTLLHSSLHRYFQLEYSLEDLYHTWSTACPRMSLICSNLSGVRVVQQDPWECLISFICSSCNNIKRITQMLESLRRNYGKYLCTVRLMENGELDVYFDNSNNGEKIDNIYDLYTFPDPEKIASISEDELRNLGFGYRAKFIVNTTKLLQEKPGGAKAWLTYLRSLSGMTSSIASFKSEFSPSSLSSSSSKSVTSLSQVETHLMECPGVGRKVADCIALFSLDQAGAIPVDTHVWEIVIRDYAPHLQLSKSLTPKIYDEVANIFQEKFGPKAGWAHSVLFAGELPEFRKFLPLESQESMKEFSDTRKRKRKEKKEELKNNKKG